ncbi:MAG: hypothetical protein PHS41_12795, partial [Victivallaceae bacterium]|nr:hypothetical protein [Victivallaceae bacterium]
IHGPDALRALAEGFLRPADNAMPAPCDTITLTLEIFSGTSEYPETILRKMHDSVAYWRKFIPEDGIRLDELCRIGMGRNHLPFAE